MDLVSCSWSPDGLHDTISHSRSAVHRCMYCDRALDVVRWSSTSEQEIHLLTLVIIEEPF